jgi:hypothetical protein
MKKGKKEILREKTNRVLRKEKLNDEDVREISQIIQGLGDIEKQEKSKKSFWKLYFAPSGLKFGVLIGLALFLIFFFRDLFPINEVVIIFTGIATFILVPFAILAIPIYHALKRDTLRAVYGITIWECICVLIGGLVGAFFAPSQIAKVELVPVLIFVFVYSIITGSVVGYILGRFCIFICKEYLGFPGAGDKNTISLYFNIEEGLEKIKPKLKNILTGLGFYFRGPFKWKNIEYFKGDRLSGDPNKITITLKEKNKKITELGLTTYKDIGLEPLTTDIGQEFAKWFKLIASKSFPSITAVKSLSYADDLKSLSFKEIVVIFRPKLGAVKKWAERHAAVLGLLISILVNVILFLLRFK